MPAVNPGTANLSAWWRLEADTWQDAHSTNHLTGVAAPVAAAGKVGNAADLESGSGQYLTIPAGSQTGLAAAGSWTFGCWFRIESMGSYFVASKRDASAAEWTIIAGSAADLYLYLAPSFVPHVVSSALSVGVWVFAVCGFDSGAGVSFISVNGGAKATAARTFGGAKVCPFNLGYDQSGGLAKFDGMIDEAFFYNGRVLTDDECSWLYNAGAGRAYSALAPALGLPVLVHHHSAVYGGG